MSSQPPNSNAEKIILMDSIEVEEQTINDYKKLNDKCDIVITKIKVRKEKKNKKTK